MYICVCEAVTDRDIRNSVHEGTTTYEGLCEQLGCGGQCGQCIGHIRMERDKALTDITVSHSAA